MPVYKVEIINHGVKNKYNSTIMIDVPDVEPIPYIKAFIEKSNKRLYKRFKGNLWDEFVRIICVEEYAGKDRYGLFHNFTGKESKGKCFWCGVAVSRGARYCCGDHQLNYTRHYRWDDARFWCWERYEQQCADCGKSSKETPERDLYVHHIVPMSGEYRNWHWLNRPENLVLLCMLCHMQRHKELNYLKRRYEAALNPAVAIVDPQLSLFLKGELDG